MIDRSLAENRRRLVERLRWPENLGIGLRDLNVGGVPGTRALLVWIDGLAGNKVLQEGILRPLTGHQGSTAPELLAQILPVPDRTWEQQFDRLLGRILEGWTALLVDGWDAALVLDTIDRPRRPSFESFHVYREAFGGDLRQNVTLLRKRVRDPRLRALPVSLHSPDRGNVALVYLEGKALPSLVRLLRLWISCHMGEEMSQRGLQGGLPAVFGFLPRFDSSGFPDDMALLVTMGYVLVLTDRVDRVLAAPVTIPFWLTSIGDVGSSYPVRRFLASTRLFLHMTVLMLPGTLVSLMNYHVDMVPTAFLAAIGAARENAPFGLIFEILLTEFIVEIGREISFRLPVGVHPGVGLVALAVTMLLLMQAGFVGPLSAMVSLVGALIALALPNYAGTYMVRVWRYYMLLAAAILGFFGMATILAIFLAYLLRSRTWGIPVWGPSGTNFTGPEARATQPPRRSGGKRLWHTHG